jgi:hypothetical protein
VIEGAAFSSPDVWLPILLGLIVALGARRWAGDLIARVRWLLQGGARSGDLITVDGVCGEVSRVGLTRLGLKLPGGSTAWFDLGSVTAIKKHDRGHQACIVDIVLPTGNDQAKFIEGMVVTRTESMRERFPHMLRGAPKILGRRETNAGQSYIRVYFPVWPGMGGVVEAVFKPQIATALKRLDAEYAEWMVTVTYDLADAV